MEGPTGSSTEQNINLVLPLLLCLHNPPYLLVYPTSPGNSLRFRAIISSNHGPGRPIVNTYMTTSDLCGEGTLLSPCGRLINEPNSSLLLCPCPLSRDFAALNIKRHISPSLSSWFNQVTCHGPKGY